MSSIPLVLASMLLSAASRVHQQSSLYVLITVFATMLLAGEVGFRAGRRQKSNETGCGHFVAVQAALLAILDLLLVFSLKMADQRYEARRASMMDDNITLAALSLRGDFLLEPSLWEMKRHLGHVQCILLDVFVIWIIYVIHDLDTPMSGGAQAGGRPMIHLTTVIEREEAALP